MSTELGELGSVGAVYAGPEHVRTWSADRTGVYCSCLQWSLVVLPNRAGQQQADQRHSHHVIAVARAHIDAARALADEWDAEPRREFGVGDDYTHTHSRELRAALDAQPAGS